MEYADLHIHTTASDGVFAPADVVCAAAAMGLSAIAITDHDVTDGLPEARQAGERHGLTVLAGVEINTDHGETEVHVLGYGMDIEQPGFQRTMDWLRQGRVDRAREMVEKLRRLGCPLSWERVAEIAGPGAMGRPHIALALVEAGHAVSREDAFLRYLGNNGPAYVPRARFNANEAIATIRQAGGVPVVAHPVKIGDDSVIPALVDAGLMGLEACHPDHDEECARYYVQMAEALGIVWTGGSDFHGNNEARPLGGVKVPVSQVAALLAAKA